MQHIRLVLVGDGTVGKTSLIVTYCTNTFPVEFIPAVFDNYTCSVVDENRFIPQIIDTIALDEYKNGRIKSYQYTHVFMICFSLGSISSMENVENIWIPEIKQYCPNVPYILVGTKSDLRDNSPNDSIITSDQGKQLKNKIKAKHYIECSALKNQNVAETFKLAMKVGEQNLQKSKHCNIE